MTFDNGAIHAGGDAEIVQIGVGCHVMLVDGEPLLPPAQNCFPACERNPTLSNRDSRVCIFGNSRRLSPDEITAEAACKYAGFKARASKSRISTRINTRICFLKSFDRCFVPLKNVESVQMRNPFAPIKALAIASVFRRPKLWVRYSEVKFLRRFRRQSFHREVEQAGLRTTMAPLDQPREPSISSFSMHYRFPSRRDLGICLPPRLQTIPNLDKITTRLPQFSATPNETFCVRLSLYRRSQTAA